MKRGEFKKKLSFHVKWGLLFHTTKASVSKMVKIIKILKIHHPTFFNFTNFLKNTSHHEMNSSNKLSSMINYYAWLNFLKFKANLVENWKVLRNFRFNAIITRTLKLYCIFFSYEVNIPVFAKFTTKIPSLQTASRLFDQGERQKSCISDSLSAKNDRSRNDLSVATRKNLSIRIFTRTMSARRPCA